MKKKKDHRHGLLSFLLQKSDISNHHSSIESILSRRGFSNAQNRGWRLSANGRHGFGNTDFGFLILE
ncbi:MAG: hypothetical protein KDA92_09840 [Planctomycetales bacterium]|nr:hypothetical protein [Planctomycetales bacterium]